MEYKLKRQQSCTHHPAQKQRRGMRRRRTTSRKTSTATAAFLLQVCTTLLWPQYTSNLFGQSSILVVSAFENAIFHEAMLAFHSVSLLSVDEFVFAAANLNLQSSSPSAATATASATSGYQSLPPRIRIAMPNLSKGTDENNHNSNIRLQHNFYDDYDFDNNRQFWSVSPSAVAPTLLLTPDEVELFQIVQEVRDLYSPSTTIRVAGGWVRDKLLSGLTTTTTSTATDVSRNAASTFPSHDIDFVLSDISGSEFANYFCQHVQRKQQQQQQQEQENHFPQDLQLQLVQEAEPTKSHHLQTATLKFQSFCLDFGNLRYERYTHSHSRVPSESGVASVVQDAWRRDLTINSLFYNLQTNQVEDWTEQGLQDLQLGVIATPFAPLATVLEDPLRMLRAVRFAAQCSFGMDPTLKRALRSPRARQALRQKVSKDRIGAEVHALFQTRDPTRGIQLLLETQLIDQLFPLPDKYDNDNETKDEIKGETTTTATIAFIIPSDSRNNQNSGTIYMEGCRLLSRTQSLVSRTSVSSLSSWSDEKRRHLWYAAFLKPFSDSHNKVNENAHNKVNEDAGRKHRRDNSLVYQLLTVNLKRPTTETKSIEQIIQGADVLQSFILQNYHQFHTLLESNDTGEEYAKNSDECPVVASGSSMTNSYWSDMASLRWTTYQTLKQVGAVWKESLLLALASSSSFSATSLQQNGLDTKHHGSLDTCEQYYEQWLWWIEDRLQLTQAELFDPQLSYAKNPILNGSQILQNGALPRLRPGKDFHRIMKAQEEWQVRQGILVRQQRKDNQSLSQKIHPLLDETSALINHLVTTFPEYT